MNGQLICRSISTRSIIWAQCCSETDINDNSLILQYFSAIHPDALHQDLPPALGPLNRTPLPAIFPTSFPCFNGLRMCPTSLSQRRTLTSSHCVLSKGGQQRFSSLQSADSVQLILCLLHYQVNSGRSCAANAKNTLPTIDEHKRKYWALDDFILHQLGN